MPCVGQERHSEVSTIPASLSLRCGMIGIGRGGILPLGTLMDLGLPATTSPSPWWNILTSSGIDDIVDPDRNLCFRFSGVEYGGGQIAMMRKFFCDQNSTLSYSRNTKGRETTTNLPLPLVSSITTTFD